MKKPKESYTFLVDSSKDVKRLGYKYSQRNMLGYLVFKHNYYSEYRAEHNGFFYVPSSEIQKAVGISKNTVTLYAMRFLSDGLIDYSAGKRHHCSEYRLKFDFQKLNVHNQENQTEVIDTKADTEISGNQYCNGYDCEKCTPESVGNEDVTEISGNQYYESGENGGEKYESVENENDTRISGNQNTEPRIKNEEYRSTEYSTYGYSDLGLAKNEQEPNEVCNLGLAGNWSVNSKGFIKVFPGKWTANDISGILYAAKTQLEESPILLNRLQTEDSFYAKYRDYVINTLSDSYGFSTGAIDKVLKHCWNEVNDNKTKSTNGKESEDVKRKCKTYTRRGGVQCNAEVVRP